MSKRILLAWEGGAGRGHIVTLRIMAEALGPQYQYEAALCRMEHAAELAAVCDQAYPSAGLYLHPGPRRALGWPRTASWGDFLGDLGFAFPERLQVQFDWWMDVLRNRQFDLLIADFAPISLLAARALRLPAVCVGTGYSTPPPGLDRFPILLPEYDVLVHDEATLLSNVNGMLSAAGAEPLQRFSDIYGAAVSMPRTIGQLDPYNGHRLQPLLPPLNEAVPRASGAGDEVFVYFSTAETAYAPLVDALCTLDLPVRAFLPGADKGLLERLATAGVMVESGPVPVDLIAARSRVLLNAGQHGTLCMGLGLGLPQLAFPQHLEHQYHARRAADLGAVDIGPYREWTTDRIRAAVHELYHDAARAERVRHLSIQLSAELFGDIGCRIRQRLEPLLA